MVGVLCLLNRKEASYDDQELKVLDKALSFLATIILYSQLSILAVKEVDDAKIMNEKVVDELKRSKILLEFASSLYREDNLSKLMEQIILRARDLLSADQASVFVVDKERKEVIMLHSNFSSILQFSMPT